MVAAAVSVPGVPRLGREIFLCRADGDIFQRGGRQVDADVRPSVSRSMRLACSSTSKAASESAAVSFWRAAFESVAPFEGAATGVGGLQGDGELMAEAVVIPAGKKGVSGGTTRWRERKIALAVLGVFRFLHHRAAAPTERSARRLHRPPPRLAFQHLVLFRISASRSASIPARPR